MEEARAVLDRLERIEALKYSEAPVETLLEEVRLLLAEAEAWIEADGPSERAEAALEACREALAEPASVA